ncbi:MAG: ABC transporter ATP-binding protein [Acidimicrobiia bacterium]|jgi:ABC-2 type transport system ATP-binding protein
MKPVVTVVGLSKRYGELQAVADVSFEVHEAEIFGLLGPNGAGKTTSVECIQGLRRPDAGCIEVLGLDPQHEFDRLRTLIGSQLQESSLPHRMKVWEALDLFSSLQAGGPPWRTVMAEWGLSEKAGASFGSLSGGQRQRLLVALALVNGPRVVFLDEMTTGLDPAARRATWELIERIRGAGTTVVLVTHFMDEADRLCDRLAVIHQGRVVASGTPAGLVASHGGDVTVNFSAGVGDVGFLLRVPGVHTVEMRGSRAQVRGRPSIVPLIGKALVERGLVPDDMDVARPTLEDVYLHLVRGDDA